jgi:hypothetical protein
MQLRIFSVEGAPVVIERNGFFETHGTLAALIADHQRSVPMNGGAATSAAPSARLLHVPDASPPPVQASVAAAADASLLDVAVVATTEPKPSPRKRTVPRRQPKMPVKPKAPGTGPTVAVAEALPTMVGPAPNNDVFIEAAGIDMTPTSAEAMPDGGSEPHVARRSRAGRAPPPRWKIAGKLRRGRPT